MTVNGGECVYCGDRADTEDHIPPVCLFPKPHPADLIRVPSCKHCNNKASKDDEYFRLVLCMRRENAEHPAVTKLFPVVLRSLEHPKKLKMQRAVAKQITRLLERTPGGLIVPVPAYHVDLVRVHNVLGRITAGLFYHVFGRRLPVGVEARGFSAPNPQYESFEAQMKFQALNAHMSVYPARIVGDGIFSFQYWVNPADPEITGWRLIFYGASLFMGATRRVGASQKSA